MTNERGSCTTAVDAPVSSSYGLRPTSSAWQQYMTYQARRMLKVNHRGERLKNCDSTPPVLAWAPKKTKSMWAKSTAARTARIRSAREKRMLPGLLYQLAMAKRTAQ